MAGVLRGVLTRSQQGEVPGRLQLVTQKQDVAMRRVQSLSLVLHLWKMIVTLAGSQITHLSGFYRLHHKALSNSKTNKWMQM